MLQNKIYERARLSRDARFDGQFFVGVKTTGIYCRPICPANAPKSENVSFFPTAAAAGEAGFRPCLRCRPECAPGTPAWGGTSTTVRRGLRLIASGALDDSTVEDLATRLGVTSRHLRRLFTRHLGASPLAVAHTQRLHFAKQLIDQTRLPMQDIAVAAGYGSTRRFNDSFVKTYGRSPRELRRAGQRLVERRAFRLTAHHAGPADGERHVNTGVVEVHLGAGERHAVVAGDHHERVVGLAGVFEEFQHRAHVAVEPLDLQVVVIAEDFPVLERLLFSGIVAFLEHIKSYLPFKAC